VVDLYASNHLYFLKALGQAYRPNVLDGPKPLLMLLTGLLPRWGWDTLFFVGVATTIYAFCRLSRHFTGSVAAGVATFMLYLFANTTVLGDLSGQLAPTYIVFTLLALIFFIDKRFKACSLSLLLSGLIRPETWLLAFVYALNCFFGNRSVEEDDGKKILRCNTHNVWILVPLAAPLIWVLTDLALSGGRDPLYSSHLAHIYSVISGRVPMKAYRFLPLLVATPYYHFCGWAFWGGAAAGLGMILNKKTTTHREFGALWVIALTPVFFYGLNCLFHPFDLDVRFFSGTAMVMYFFLCVTFYRFTPRIAKVFVLAAIVLLAFNYQNLMSAVIGGKAAAKYKTATVNQLCVFMDSHPINGRVIAGEMLDKLSLRYGAEFSSRTLNLREISGGKEEFRDGDYVIWSFDDETGNALKYSFLANGIRCKLGKVIFEPYFTSEDNLSSIFKIKIEKA